MQNFEIKNKLLLQENKNEIKKLWRNNFLDDDEKTIDCFLENVFENKKGVGAFINNELVAMVLFLNSKIIIKNKKIKSVYFYAVCTDEKYRKKGVMRNLFSFATEETKKQGYEMCFLVPQNAELFKMYEKFSFKRTIGYDRKVFERDNCNNKNTLTQKSDFCYDDYKRIKLNSHKNEQFVLWDKDEYEFIFNENREDVSFIFTDSSFAIYEKSNSEILIHEISGDYEGILNYLFNTHIDCERIILRVPCIKNETDFGMTLTLSQKEIEANSIYFGMPYG